MTPSPQDLGRFFAKVDIPTDPDDCWLWNAATTRTGYGLIRWPDYSARGPARAPRIAYELFHGPIPPGLEIDHRCNRPGCVNPTHLRAITHRANTLRSQNPCAINARKTHCVHGHLLSTDNLYTSTGHRQCRRCILASSRRAVART